MGTYESHQPLKSWAEEDRPREKFLRWGKNEVSNAELIAIILGSGYKNQTAIDLARRLLDQSQNKLDVLSKFSPAQLQRTKGIGMVKAVTLLAAIELGKRSSHEVPLKGKFIKSSQEAYHWVRNKLSNLPHEEFHTIFLSRSNKILSIQKISSGGITGTVVDGRIIFKTAIEVGATSIILVHNHPSGQIRPSQADKDITQQLVDSGKFLNIQVVDHLIIGEGAYFSFADEGLI